MGLFGGFRRLNFMLRNAVGVHWRLNRRVFIWLGIFLALGIILGLIIMFSPKITYKNISNNLLDTNLRRVITPTAGFGGIIFARLFDFALVMCFIFVCSLHRWTVLLCFPFAAFRGFCLVMNLYWIVAKFGFITGAVLFFIYLFWFLLLLIIFLTAIVFMMRHCGEVRCGGFRGGMRWGDFVRGLIVFFVVLFVFAFLEWLVYWLILSKIVFIV